MSDIKLFTVSPNVQPIELKPARLERDIQRFIEANMDTLFGVRFLDTEYVISHVDDYEAQGGRIDSLGLDENNCPIVFEYKRDSNENVINQGLFYLDWLLDHQADFKLLVMEKLGGQVADQIDWSSPAVYCVANAFGKYDLHAIKQMNRNIRLIRYADGGDVVLFEYLNAPSVSSLTQQTLSATGVSSERTYGALYEAAPQAMRDLVEEVRQYMKSFGDDVSENNLKHYLAIKKARNIVCVKIQQRNVLLYVALDPSTVEQTDIVSDCSNRGHNGTGDVEINLKTMDDLEAVKPLLERVYREN